MGYEPSPPVLSVRLWRSLLCQPFDEARCRPAEKTGEVVTDPGERSSADSFIKAYQEAGQFVVHPETGERHSQLIRGDREVRDVPFKDHRHRFRNIRVAEVRVAREAICDVVVPIRGDDDGQRLPEVPPAGCRNDGVTDGRGEDAGET